MKVERTFSELDNCGWKNRDCVGATNRGERDVDELRFRTVSSGWLGVTTLGQCGCFVKLIGLYSIRQIHRMISRLWIEVGLLTAASFFQGAGFSLIAPFFPEEAFRRVSRHQIQK